MKLHPGQNVREEQLVSSAAVDHLSHALRQLNRCIEFSV